MEQHLAYVISHYGYVGIYAALALGVIGLPLPDEALMAFLGYMVSQGKVLFSLSLLSAFLGSATGITVSYILGLKLGLPFLKKYGPKIHITEQKLQWTHNLFEKYGSVLLFFGYFIPGVRHITAYLAGISGMERRTFALFAYSGALLWSFSFIMLGRALGENWHRVERIAHRYGWYLVICIVLLGLVSALLLRLRRSRT
ncbi:DedA family protein [Brevibacillus massiliensis]|uniref:DedA family protein n=1 Tax=Brevibacillus massiliensis TaxID=1118054 RepID=UPI0002FBD4F6|nr:DedA family protein [Brevibacillus massiliensis]